MRNCVFAVLCLMTFTVEAAGLKPFQQAALEKILATLPAEQREMARPTLEMTLANLSEAHVAMMLAQYDARAAAEAAAPAEEAADESAGEWGPAEADFEKHFPQIQAYMDRISDRHDAMRKRWEEIPPRLENEWHSRNEYGGFAEASPIDVCAMEMNLVPRQRRQSAEFMRDTLADQDRISTRTLIELRAQYPTLAAYAKAIRMSEQDEHVQGMRHHFAKPLSEAEVMAKLAGVSDRIAVLIEMGSKERHRIDMSPYADSQMGSGSPARDRDLHAHEQRVRKEAAAICSEGLAAYMAGLASVVNPIVPKVKAQLD